MKYAKFEVAGHEPSIVPDGKWKLVWSDEFDGNELDMTEMGLSALYDGQAAYHVGM